MPAGTRIVPGLRQQIAHAAVSMDVIRVEAQRAFKMQPGLLLFAEQKQQISKIDVPGGIIRMVPNGLTEQRAGGLLVSGVKNQRSEIIECAKIGGRSPKQFEIVGFGFFELALFTEQTCAFEAGVKRVRISLEFEVERPHPQGAGGRSQIVGDLAQMEPRNAESDRKILEQNLP